MKKLALPLWSAALWSVWTLSTLHAETQTSWKGTSEISFSGTSTLHSWAGKVSATPFTATVTENASAEPSHLTAKVEVHAAQMDTAEPKRDTNMHTAMDVKEFPLISGAVDTRFQEINGGGKTPTTLPLKLTLLGKTHEVKGHISNWTRHEGSVSFDLDFDLSLKECGIQVPSMLLVVRVGDTVKVHAPVKLVRQ